MLICRTHPRRRDRAAARAGRAEPLTPEGKAWFERLAASLEQSGSMRPAFKHFNADGTLTEAQIEQAVERVRANDDTKALAALRALPASVVNDDFAMMTREEHFFGGPIGDGVIVPDHYEAIYRVGREPHECREAKRQTSRGDPT